MLSNVFLTRGRYVLRIVDRSGNVSADCWNLHPIRPSSHCTGSLDGFCLHHCVEPRHPGNCVQEFRSRNVLPSRLSWCIYGNGLAGCVCDASFTDALTWHGIFWIAVVELCLYSGYRLPCPRPAVVLPCLLASFCAGRKHLSLLRRAVLCCPTARLKRKSLVTTGVHSSDKVSNMYSCVSAGSADSNA